MDKIIISDLAVQYHVGVSDRERANPQRLLLNLEMECDLSAAAATDELSHTIDYHAVAQRLLRFGDRQSWRLLEKLAVDVADLLLTDFQAASVSVEVRKFVVPEAGYVAVRVTRAARPRPEIAVSPGSRASGRSHD